MKSSKQKQHLESCHSDLMGKSVEHFEQKAVSLKDSGIDSTGMWARKKCSTKSIVLFCVMHTPGQESSYNR